MPRLLTLKQAARRLGVHPETVRRWMKAGLIVHRRTPGTRKYMFAECDLVVEPQRIAA